MAGEISTWDTTSITDMSFVFNDATGFDADIGSWNTASVTNMASMFDNAQSFNHDLSRWDVQQVTSMYGMFRDARAFNQDISGWSVGAVADGQMRHIFRDATSLTTCPRNGCAAWFGKPTRTCVATIYGTR